MQRRDFIRTVFLGTATLAVGPGIRALAAQRIAPAEGNDWAAGGFEHVVGESFQVTGPAGVQQLRLAAAERRKRGNVESVSLRFAGKTHARLAEGSYEFRHRALGTIVPHIVPSAVSGRNCYYRVTLTRFV